MQSLRNEVSALGEHLQKAGSELRFAIESTNVDELVCSFTDTDQTKHPIICNILEGYPDIAPIWSSDTENANVTNILDKINEQPGQTITQSCQALVNQLNTAFGIVHTYVDLCNGAGGCGAKSDSQEEEMEEEDEDDYIDLDSDQEEDMCDLNSASDEVECQGMKPEHFANLEKIKLSVRRDHEQGVSGGSVQATDRLMKELRDIYRSDSYKNGVYSVEMNNDNLYEWDVRLEKVDSDSPLMDDINKLKETTTQGYIHLSIRFFPSFPFEPPFVRVVHPPIEGGYVLSGGAICMELLTCQGWSSAYSIESLILQISATLVKGKARIKFSSKEGKSYTLERAMFSYSALVATHQKKGWVTPPKEEG